MDFSISVPALLFPAISLLLLAYTNRFLALSSVIRTLYRDYQTTPDAKIVRQISNLRRRVQLIRGMQALGVASMLLCVLDMFLILARLERIAPGVFAISLVLMLISLALSIIEIWMSGEALNILLSDIEGALAEHAEAALPLTKDAADKPDNPDRA